MSRPNRSASPIPPGPSPRSPDRRRATIGGRSARLTIARSRGTSAGATTLPRNTVLPEGILGSELVVFEDSGHMLWDEEPDMFGGAILDFMERIS